MLEFVSCKFGNEVVRGEEQRTEVVQLSSAQLSILEIDDRVLAGLEGVLAQEEGADESDSLWVPDDDRRERGDLALGAELDQVVQSLDEDRMQCTTERDVAERE